MDRAFVFAYAAADAELRVHKRPLELSCRAVPHLQFHRLNPDRLGRGRTDLFAYDTIDIHRPGQASSPVIKGCPDLDRLLSVSSELLFERKRSNRTGRADVAAEQAVIFAVTDPVDQYRRP